MIRSLNLKLYFLLMGVFLIFNLSCEDEDLTIESLVDDTMHYTLSVSSEVCSPNEEPNCQEGLIDYNDETVADYTIISLELMSFPLDDNEQPLL